METSNGSYLREKEKELVERERILFEREQLILQSQQLEREYSVNRSQLMTSNEGGKLCSIHDILTEPPYQDDKAENFSTQNRKNSGAIKSLFGGGKKNNNNSNTNNVTVKKSKKKKHKSTEDGSSTSSDPTQQVPPPPLLSTTISHINSDPAMKDMLIQPTYTSPRGSPRGNRLSPINTKINNPKKITEQNLTGIPNTFVESVNENNATLRRAQRMSLMLAQNQQQQWTLPMSSSSSTQVNIDNMDNGASVTTAATKKPLLNHNRTQPIKGTHSDPFAYKRQQEQETVKLTMMLEECNQTLINFNEQCSIQTEAFMGFNVNMSKFNQDAVQINTTNESTLKNVAKLSESMKMLLDIVFSSYSEALEYASKIKQLNSAATTTTLTITSNTNKPNATAAVVATPITATSLSPFSGNNRPLRVNNNTLTIVGDKGPGDNVAESHNVSRFQSEVIQRLQELKTNNENIVITQRTHQAHIQQLHTTQKQQQILQTDSNSVPGKDASEYESIMKTELEWLNTKLDKIAETLAGFSEIQAVHQLKQVDNLTSVKDMLVAQQNQIQQLTTLTTALLEAAIQGAEDDDDDGEGEDDSD
jgi:hypothetical protein